MRGLAAKLVVVDELQDIDLSIFDPPVDQTAPYRHDPEAYRRTIVRLERLNAGPFCGMTSRRNPPWTATRLVPWTVGTRRHMLKIRFSCWEVLREVEEWAGWLRRALGIGHPDGSPAKLSDVAQYLPAPQPRLFGARAWIPGGRRGR